MRLYKSKIQEGDDEENNFSYGNKILIKMDWHPDKGCNSAKPALQELAQPEIVRTTNRSV